MYRSADEILHYARRTISQLHTRNAEELVRLAGITVKPVHFARQKGVYLVIERNPFIFIKDDLESGMRDIVLLHELGHHYLHRGESTSFQEFNIFDMRGDRMEFEANLFAAEISLPDDEILAYIEQGYDASQIASAMYSDINLVALKVSDLNRRGLHLRAPERDDLFLGK